MYKLIDYKFYMVSSNLSFIHNSCFDKLTIYLVRFNKTILKTLNGKLYI